MTPEHFCYWLKGALELRGKDELSGPEVSKIEDHLKLVFNKVTPAYTHTDPNPATGLKTQVLDSPLINKSTFIC